MGTSAEFKSVNFNSVTPSDGHSFVTGNYNDTVRIYDARSMARAKTVIENIGSPCDFDGQYLVAINADKLIVHDTLTRNTWSRIYDANEPFHGGKIICHNKRPLLIAWTSSNIMTWTLMDFATKRPPSNIYAVAGVCHLVTDPRACNGCTVCAVTTDGTRFDLVIT